MRLFCLPYAGGSQIIYYDWKRYIDQLIKVDSIELKGRGKRYNEGFYQNFKEAVDDVFDNVKEKIAEEDYAIYGHSMGSLLAYELYYRISDQNFRKPKHIFFQVTKHQVLKEIKK